MILNTLKRISFIFCATLFVLFVHVLKVQAQHSLVPAHHQVYDWLLSQRVAGNLKYFDNESIPLTRGQITKMLNEIKKASEEKQLFWSLGTADRSALESYLQEFDSERIGENEFYKVVSDSRYTWKERAINLWKEQPTPSLFAYNDKEEKINASFFLQYGRDEVNLWEGKDKDWSWGRTKFKGLRAYGSFYDFLGIHVEVTNIDIQGEKKLFDYYPPYAYSFAIEKQKKDNSQTHENSLSLRKGVLGFDISSGSIQVGPSLTEPLFFSKDAANMNWLRFTINLEWMNFTAIHGSLYATPNTSKMVVGTDTIGIRTAPARWIAAHRLTLRPWHWFEFSFNEMLVYSLRSPDYAYMNPVSPIFFSELDNGDRDNALIGADVIIRPFRGTELFSSVLIDDLMSLDQLFKDIPHQTVRVAKNIGLYQTLPWSFRFGMSYTVIQPFVYSHKFRLNTYEQRDRSLGPVLGPNSDELTFQIKKFLPYRGWGLAQISFVRKGMNWPGATSLTDGTTNVGGDLLLGGTTIGKKTFQDSDLHAWWELTLGAQIEPIRGIILSTKLMRRNVYRGTQIKSYTFTMSTISFGF